MRIDGFVGARSGGARFSHLSYNNRIPYGLFLRRIVRCGNAMADRPSLLDELRTEYEAVRRLPDDHAEVETFQQIDARLRKAFRWLEKAIAYLDGLKPAIDHRYDLGHGLVFEAPHFGRGFVGQHERRIAGYPVLDEINVYYVITAARPLAIDVAPGGVALAEQSLDGAGLQYTSRSTEDAAGAVRKCRISVPPEIPAAVTFQGRLPDRQGDGCPRQRRSPRARDARVSQRRDRRAGARRPDPPDPGARFSFPAPRAARRPARQAVVRAARAVFSAAEDETLGRRPRTAR